MLCNPISYYPAKIDEMTFFQDNNLEKVEILNHYNELIAQGKYSEASNYINQQEAVYGFFDDYLNLIENRIYALQEHTLSIPPKKQPFIYYNKEEHFSFGDLCIFTDTDEEEDLSAIFLFSDNEQQESIENLFMFTGGEGQPHKIDNDTIWI
ncbi:MAG: hypothetical protein HDR71_13295 [Lachnospiraceae bacterium]|nr:hypothetical protein [Lachnospiraceae bacterium]